MSDEHQYLINEIINHELPKPLRIKYVHYDMKIRKKEHDFPRSLHEIIRPYIKKMGVFFCTRNKMSDTLSQIKVQRGVIRTNCIDSLDRTNEG